MRYQSQVRINKEHLAIVKSPEDFKLQHKRDMFSRIAAELVTYIPVDEIDNFEMPDTIRLYVDIQVQNSANFNSAMAIIKSIVNNEGLPATSKYALIEATKLLCQ